MMMVRRGSMKTVSKDTIFDAVVRGSLESVMKLLEEGHSPDLSPAGVPTPIYRAIRFCQPDIALALIKAGCRISWQRRQGSGSAGTLGSQNHPPLICLAAELNMSEVVLELMKRQDCDIFARCNDSSTVMHIAVRRNNYLLVKELLTRHQRMRSPFLKLRDDNGLTPLHLAAASGSLKILSILLSLGDETFADLESGLTSPLPSFSGKIITEDSCTLDDGTNFMKELVNLPSLGTKYTPLHLAAEGRHVDVMKFLISHGAEVNTRNIDCNTPLHCLCMEGNADHRAIEAAKILLEAGADCNLPGTMFSCSRNKPLRQMTVPMIATCRNRVCFLQLFSNHGANFTATNEHGMTTLMLALASGSEEAAMYLLTSHPEPTHFSSWVDANGRTNMHYVSHCRSKAGQLAQKLLVRGYNYTQVSGLKSSCCPQLGCGIVALPAHPVSWAITHGQLCVLAAICSHNPALLLDTSHINSETDSPLHVVSFSLYGSNCEQFCAFLLRHGVDPNFTVNGATALDCAKVHENEHMTRLLQTIKCDSYAAESPGITLGHFPCTLKHAAMAVVRQCVRRRRHNFAQDIASLPVPRAVAAALTFSNYFGRHQKDSEYPFLND